ncbi:tyrosine-protein phosphatase non-receptor type 6 protein [Diplodia corticola]|uniref:Tyrosine-protein phosphatase non-receptor type 6 protein n=1 Tax=Diplodia corticola TaxID=236234 RepID=A0A1J9R0Q0_9PEZI|nr:tyrosine-protein phosphatase non-receptor type 6 protein [Diplodia corticola]OJD34950.1 tyrosine-protein phosphatase non-receptor type 6 protein [Diplodia corticola]
MAFPEANNTDSLALGLRLGLASPESVHGKHEEAKVAFNKFVDARYKDGSSAYSEVGVLLVCWTDDDLDVKAEVDMLKQVFDEQFRFYTEVYKIPSEDSAAKLRAKMQRWAHKFEGAQKLSIIYYAGHGSQVDGNSTDLAIHGTRQETKANTFFNSSFQPLNLTDTDCLLILDCCFAAASFSRGEIGRRKFELLCSVAPSELAYGPKNASSFTKVLCAALEDLLVEHPSQGFSTSELYRKLYHKSIRTKKPFLFDQSSKNFGWIYLRPFYYGPEAKQENIAVELRLEMSRMPAEPEMKELAAHMQYLPLVKKLKFQHLHAPDHILQEFFDDLIRRQRIRPFIRTLRQRVAMRRNKAFGLPDTEEEKRVARDDVIDLYDWGVESEHIPPRGPVRRASMHYKKGLSRQTTAVDSSANDDNCIEYEDTSPTKNTVFFAVSLTTALNSPVLRARRKYAELSPIKHLLEFSVTFLILSLEMMLRWCNAICEWARQSRRQRD